MSAIKAKQDWNVAKDKSSSVRFRDQGERGCCNFKRLGMVGSAAACFFVRAISGGIIERIN